MDFIKQFFTESKLIIEQLDLSQIGKCVDILVAGRANAGRLFILGVGGSAANASHAVNDFRKIVGIEAYAPTDNVSELTARTNDEGWATVFSNWLQVSRLNANDMILILSVGGGNIEKNISPNLVAALQYAKKINAKIMGIVGRDGGYTHQIADACVLIPTPNPLNTTPHAESFQAVIWHLLVSHPKLKMAQTKWESVAEFKSFDALKVKIFADGADKSGIIEMNNQPFISGFTTNPTLMCKAGISNYEAFAKDILTIIKNRPISFEVFSDDFDEMYAQALTIASWGPNVYVKIPVTNTKGQAAYDLIHKLACANVKQNVTAIMTLDQVRQTAFALASGPSSCVSVFAGRVADTGRDPVLMMSECVQILKPYPQLELIWASPRELLNIFQADDIGCHIITVTNDILKKLNLVGKDLQEYSLETVQMFYNDAQKSGFTL